MALVTRRAARYVRAWLSGPSALDRREDTLDRDGVTVPATVYRPRGASGPLPGWVVLHGMTRLGRSHAQLTRFTEALVSSGAAAIVPEIPEWRHLSLSPHLATPTVRAAIDGLLETGWAADRPVGVIGFSFGAPHAIVAAGDPGLSGRIAGAVGFGGYCHVEDTFRFMMTGETEDGRRLIPDPYGRWIVAANYLTGVPELEDHGDVTAALRELAFYSGDLGAPSWEPVYDSKISELRERVAPGHREMFDLFALPGGALPDRDAALAVSERLAIAGRRIDPLLDPLPGLARVRRPVHVLHGYSDRLISCDEAPKMTAALPAAAHARGTVTRLFGHSSQDPLPTLRAMGEAPRFLRALSGVLGVP